MKQIRGKMGFWTCRRMLLLKKKKYAAVKLERAEDGSMNEACPRFNACLFLSLNVTSIRTQVGRYRAIIYALHCHTQIISFYMPHC